MYQWILRDYTLVYMIAKGLVSGSDSSPCTKYLRVFWGGGGIWTAKLVAYCNNLKKKKKKWLPYKLDNVQIFLTIRLEISP